jgi:regulator of sirC expression with transglutaminase-like and TPR domain
LPGSTFRHFLVKLPLNEGALLIDVFVGGVVLSRRNCDGRLSSVFDGDPPRPLEAYLHAASEREVTRWLHNLNAFTRRPATGSKC